MCSSDLVDSNLYSCVCLHADSGRHIRHTVSMISNMYAHIFFSLTTGRPPPEDKIIDISAYPLPQSINAAAVSTYIGGGAARR